MKIKIGEIMKSIMTIMFIFLMPALFGQPYTSVEDVDILEQQKDVLKQKYEHEFDELEVLGGYRLDEIHTMVAYKKNGIYHEAVMNSERKEMMLVSTAAEIPIEDVPNPVNSALEDSEYANSEIVKAFRVNTPYGEDFIRVDVKNGDSTDRVFYTELGARQKDLY